MTEDRQKTGEKKPSGNVMVLVIIACWVLFLYFFGVVKGPG
jgi:hypothetical protein